MGGSTVMSLVLAAILGCTAADGPLNEASGTDSKVIETVQSDAVAGKQMGEVGQKVEKTLPTLGGIADGHPEKAEKDAAVAERDAALAIMEAEGVFDAAAALNVAVTRNGNIYRRSPKGVAEVRRSIETYIAKGDGCLATPDEAVLNLRPTEAVIAKGGDSPTTKDKAISNLALRVIEKTGRAYNKAPGPLQATIARGASALGDIKGIVQSALMEVASVNGLAEKGKEYLVVAGAALMRSDEFEKVYGESQHKSPDNPIYNQTRGIDLIGSSTLSAIISDISKEKGMKGGTACLRLDGQ